MRVLRLGSSIFVVYHSKCEQARPSAPGLEWTTLVPVCRLRVRKARPHNTITIS